ncbi:MAG: MarR family transcriptional regulator [Saprospiraceae bacterium]|nr:MarR family transcriptional regulator [Saprospiraceae bacterium]
MEINKEINQTHFKNNFFKAYINLIYTSNYFRDSFNKVFSKYKITGQHYNVLRIVKGNCPQASNPGKIKEVMLDKGADLTRLLDKLEKFGWIVRESCPENRRMMNIYVSEAGLVVINDIDEELSALAENLKSLEEEEYGQISDLLDKMRG